VETKESDGLSAAVRSSFLCLPHLALSLAAKGPMVSSAWLLHATRGNIRHCRYLFARERSAEQYVRGSAVECISACCALSSIGMLRIIPVNTICLPLLFRKWRERQRSHTWPAALALAHQPLATRKDILWVSRGEVNNSSPFLWVLMMRRKSPHSSLRVPQALDDVELAGAHTSCSRVAVSSDTALEELVKKLEVDTVSLGE